MQGGARALALFLALPAFAAAAAAESFDLEEKVVDDVSKQGVEVFAGMLETFLHRDHISEKEVHCMSTSVKNVTHVAFQASTDVAAALFALLSPTGTMAEAAVATADLLILLPKLEVSFDKLFDLFGSFLGPCVGSSSREALEEASRHMANLTYVSGRLQANGADVVQELADAGSAFDAGKYGRFGQKMGTACRKVLLSKSSALPEGAPSLAAIANLTAGVLEGFFGKGFEIDITSDEVGASAHAKEDNSGDFQSFMVSDADEPSQVNFHLDLHKCIKANLDYFQPALMKTLTYLARQDLASEEDEEEALPELLTTVAEDGPDMISRCGIGEDELEMLGAAMEAMGSMHMKLKLPRSAQRAAMEGPVAELQRAAKDWKASNWYALGKDFGRMLLQMVVQTFPQKYSLGPSGVLGKRLAGPAATAEPSLLVAVSLLLVGLAGARSWRVLAARCGRALPDDLEQGPDAAVE